METDHQGRPAELAGFSQSDAEEPADLFPPLVHPQVFRVLWVLLVVLMVALVAIAAQYGRIT